MNLKKMSLTEEIKEEGFGLKDSCYSQIELSQIKNLLDTHTLTKKS